VLYHARFGSLSHIEGRTAIIGVHVAQVVHVSGVQVAGIKVNGFQFHEGIEDCFCGENAHGMLLA
jgi:hypothetical protein